MNRDTYEMLARLERLGISTDDAFALRRISMTLHRWHEQECGVDGGWIARDEETGKPYWFSVYTCKRSRYPIPDRETGALKRLAAIMARYPELAAYVQTDPRGAALYIYRMDSLGDRDIESCYSSIGVAVYK